MQLNIFAKFTGAMRTSAMHYYGRKFRILGQIIHSVMIAVTEMWADVFDNIVRYQ